MLALLGVALAANSRPGPRETALTGWLRVREHPPVFEIPHVVAFGERDEILVRRDGGWVRAYEGDRAHAVALESGQTVLARGPRLIFVEGQREPRALDPRLCAGPYWTVAFTLDLRRVSCLAVRRSLLSCPSIGVATFDASGTLIRRDVVRPAKGTCDWDVSGGDPDSFRMVGIAPDGHPVIALRLKGRGPLRYVVVALRSGDVEEVGRGEMPERSPYLVAAPLEDLVRERGLVPFAR